MGCLCFPCSCPRPCLKAVWVHLFLRSRQDGQKKGTSTQCVLPALAASRSSPVRVLEVFDSRACMVLGCIGRTGWFLLRRSLPRREVMCNAAVPPPTTLQPTPRPRQQAWTESLDRAWAPPKLWMLRSTPYTHGELATGFFLTAFNGRHAQTADCYRYTPTWLTSPTYGRREHMSPSTRAAAAGSSK